MNWEQAMREKAQGTTDAAFWMSAADEMARLIKQAPRAAVAQAHRAGWEQCQREAVDLINDMLHRRAYGELADFSDTCTDAIAAMEYKEPTDGN